MQFAFEGRLGTIGRTVPRHHHQVGGWAACTKHPSCDLPQPAFGAIAVVRSTNLAGSHEAESDSGNRVGVAWEVVKNQGRPVLRLPVSVDTVEVATGREALFLGQHGRTARPPGGAVEYGARRPADSYL